MIETFLSVGIDIGTTTTSIVFSKLKIENVAAGFVAPKIKIVGREIIYRSKIYFTPLIDDRYIDSERIKNIVREEYARAGMDPESIKTGAVIMTGETARKENAAEVLRAISSMAGSFVVAIAGPHLEAYLAGMGSGAAFISKNEGKTICNLDIGGGTTNAAIFASGKLKSTFCANIGGRVIRFDGQEPKVGGWTSMGAAVCEELGISLKKGQVLAFSDLVRIAKRLASSLLSVLKGNPDSLALKAAIGALPMKPIVADGFAFSGGVGKLYYNTELDRDMREILRYNDLGPLLAQELKSLEREIPAPVIEPIETVYATVIGAGVHSVEISGSTIFYTNQHILPLVNIPVVRIEDPYATLESIKGELLEKFDRFRSTEESNLIAIAVPKGHGFGFEDVLRLAEAIALAYKTSDMNGPVIVLCEDDIGKALGTLIKGLLGKNWEVIVVDEISLEEGDYVDLGKPLYGGTVIPVVMKTLVFSV